MAQTQKGTDQHAGQSPDKSRQQQDDVKKRQSHDHADDHRDESEQDKSQQRRSLP